VNEGGKDEGKGCETVPCYLHGEIPSLKTGRRWGRMDNGPRKKKKTTWKEALKRISRRTGEWGTHRETREKIGGGPGKFWRPSNKHVVGGCNQGHQFGVGLFKSFFLFGCFFFEGPVFWVGGGPRRYEKKKGGKEP